MTTRNVKILIKTAEQGYRISKVYCSSGKLQQTNSKRENNVRETKVVRHIWRTVIRINETDVATNLWVQEATPKT